MRHIIILICAFFLFQTSLKAENTDSLTVSVPKHVLPFGADISRKNVRTEAIALPLSGPDVCYATLVTLLLPEADTEVRLWDKDWQEVPIRMPRPVMDDFLAPDHGLSDFQLSEIRRQLKPLHIAWTWKGTEKRFEASISAPHHTDFDTQTFQKSFVTKLFSIEELIKDGKQKEK